jgi:hypothetical protein
MNHFDSILLPLEPKVPVLYHLVLERAQFSLLFFGKAFLTLGGI